MGCSLLLGSGLAANAGHVADFITSSRKTKQGVPRMETGHGGIFNNPALKVKLD